MSDAVEKERSEIPQPPAVTIRGLRFEAVPWGKARGLNQNGGLVAAVDVATGKELWLLKVYTVTYDNDMEDDKQDLFIADIAHEGGDLLRITDERRRVYFVDVARRTVADR